MHHLHYFFPLYTSLETYLPVSMVPITITANRLYCKSERARERRVREEQRQRERERENRNEQQD